MSDENNENQEEEYFPLEKILNISIKDYCNNVSRKIHQYKLVGVHLVTSERELFEIFAAKVPSNAEVVVDFQYELGGAGESYTLFRYASGIALIPKEKKNEEKNE